MDVKALLVALDRGTRFLDRAGLGGLRTAGRRALQATVARSLSAGVEGLVLSGSIQHRSYLHRLQRGEAEPYTAHLLAAATTPGCRFLDVGAFLGYYALRAAAAGARVVAVEPNPSTRRHLERNVRRNRLQDRVTVEPYAAAGRSAPVDLYVGDGDQSSSGLAPNRSNRRPLRIEARRLDDLVESVDVVKIDVEGAEIEALDGMSRLLAAGAPMTLVAECNPAGLARMGASPEALVRRLEEHGFRVAAVDEAGRRLLPWEHGVAAAAGYVNLHAVR
jgi:FkbM family methyltransferase